MTQSTSTSYSERSAALFNNGYMATVVNAISAMGRKGFTVRQLSNQTGVPDSLIRPVVARLTASGFLEASPNSTRRGSKELTVTAALGWPELKAFCRRLEPDAR